MKARLEVQFEEELRTLQFIQNLIHKWHWEFVHHCNCIQLHVINIESPSSILLLYQQHR
jgi:hypothetical protein